ncbi:HPr family phosphocarrier protein [Telmatospirillum sp.]|uniref:HPr family phosphocarrier protein n=1 Tax=Telmatospirillum sp. TaxID=2079197 RepID=UPI00283D46F7|nr:HPr family phosphocarrier protein [Telmatospirillum sp.]MDR3440380.1 HPr family phosphocarrier protein [Telmatospirillum sp.]
MPTDSQTTPTAAADCSVVTRTATITNRRGLHARAAAKFVKLASQYQAQVMVGNRGIEVSGLSIMGLMMLAAGPGSSVELKGTGSDAVEAVEALATLIDAKFDED